MKENNTMIFSFDLKCKLLLGTFVFRFYFLERKCLNQIITTGYRF